MFAIRRIIEDPQDFIPVPLELRHRRTEVIFIAMDQENDPTTSSEKLDTIEPLSNIPPMRTLASLAGCWEGEPLERGPQGEYEARRSIE